MRQDEVKPETSAPVILAEMRRLGVKPVASSAVYHLRRTKFINNYHVQPKVRKCRIADKTHNYNNAIRKLRQVITLSDVIGGLDELERITNVIKSI